MSLVDPTPACHRSRTRASPRRDEPRRSYDWQISSSIPYPGPPLVGAAFVLRPFREGDFEAALALAQDDAAARWVPSLPAADGAGVAAFYEECRREGTLLHLVIADLVNDAYLGETMLALGEHGVGEVGCCIIPAARAQGIATEALRLLADWALERLGLGRVQVFVAPENTPALRLAVASGFRREGLLRSYWEIDGGRVDAVILSRVPTGGAEGASCSGSRGTS